MTCRHTIRQFRRPSAGRTLLVLAVALLCAGCNGLTQGDVDPDAERAERTASPFDQASLNEIMLTVAGSAEAVNYFREQLAQSPGNAQLRRGLARSLSRNGQHGEARIVYRDLVEAGQATPDDRVEYALSLARLDMWEEAEGQRAQLPPNYTSARQLLLAGILADHERNWAVADDAYERARAVSAQPGAVLNNWGVSKMARGEHEEAERLFEEALVYDPGLFSAKNNLTLSYGLRHRYRLPLVTLSGEEKAVLYHNLGVLALRQNDRAVARSMFEKSLEAHPQHYAPSADKLAALSAAG